MARAFVDTDVVVYAFTTGPRAAIAEAVLQRRCEASVQVLNEFANVARRKLGMDWREVGHALAAIRTLCGDIHAVDIDTHRSGLTLAERYGFAVYDALIVAAALKTGCTTLYSQDMQHGQVIEARLTIVDPFKDAPARP